VTLHQDAEREVNPRNIVLIKRWSWGRKNRDEKRRRKKNTLLPAPALPLKQAASPPHKCIFRAMVQLSYRIKGGGRGRGATVPPISPITVFPTPLCTFIIMTVVSSLGRRDWKGQATLKRKKEKVMTHPENPSSFVYHLPKGKCSGACLTCLTQRKQRRRKGEKKEKGLPTPRILSPIYFPFLFLYSKYLREEVLEMQKCAWGRKGGGKGKKNFIPHQQSTPFVVTMNITTRATLSLGRRGRKRGKRKEKKLNVAKGFMPQHSPPIPGFSPEGYR